MTSPRPLGASRSVFSWWPMAHQSVAAFGMHRAEKYGPFTDGECRDLEQLVPHVRRALGVQGRIAEERLRGESLRSVLDRLDRAVFELDGRDILRIRWTNVPGRGAPGTRGRAPRGRTGGCTVISTTTRKPFARRCTRPPRREWLVQAVGPSQPVIKTLQRGRASPRRGFPHDGRGVPPRDGARTNEGCHRDVAAVGIWDDGAGGPGHELLAQGLSRSCDRRGVAGHPGDRAKLRQARDGQGWLLTPIGARSACHPPPGSELSDQRSRSPMVASTRLVRDAWLFVPVFARACLSWLRAVPIAML